MKLEISVEGQEPLIHKIKSQKTLIGSGSDCDVVLQAEGISRKHAVIHSDDDKYYVIDQGSTNGSFINEERLTPGSKTLFTTFFPVKLGFHVTVTLMDDDEAEAGGGFSFADSLKKPEPSIKNTSSEGASRVKATVGAGKGSPKNLDVAPGKAKKGPPGKRADKAANTEDEKKMLTTKLLAFLLVAGSIGYFYWDKKQAEVAEIAAQPPKIEEVTKKVEVQLTQQSYISPAPKGFEAAANAANIMKCSFPMEKKVCEAMRLPHKEFSITGMVMTANAYVFVLPALKQAGKTFDTFREELGWRWDYRPYFDQRLDNRDVAALYLVRGGGDLWKEIAEDDKRDWVYVIFVNQQGARVEEMLFTKADTVRELMTSPELDVFRQNAANAGMVPLEHLSGLFRHSPE
jgi:pSer/pThr/pTyr-binding forkhead associated (FHA) protein